MDFSFLPADIVSQILNFGLPAPIDIQVTGYNLQDNRQFANKLLRRIQMVPGTADLRIQQPFDEPHLHINVDRTKAQLAGFTAARRCHQPADFAQRQLPDFADFLAQSQEWRELLHRDADAAIPAGFAAGAGKYSDHRAQRRELRRFWARWRPSSGAREWPWSRTTTFSR